MSKNRFYEKINWNLWRKELLRAVIIFILLVIVSFTYISTYVEYRLDKNRFDPDMTEFPVVAMSLQVVWRNDSVSDFQLINNNTIVMNDKESEILTFDYLFYIQGLNLTPSWIDFFLYFRIEEQSFQRFPYLECSYFIEEHTEILRKDSFIKSEEGFNFYLAKVDINRWMFKDNVPSSVSGEIKFFSQ